MPRQGIWLEVESLQLLFLSVLGADAPRWFADTPSSDQVDVLGRFVLPKCSV
jgi:hypothetical protein